MHIGDQTTFKQSVLLKLIILISMLQMLISYHIFSKVIEEHVSHIKDHQLQEYQSLKPRRS